MAETPIQPDLLALVEALARDMAARDVRREGIETRRRIAEERSPPELITVDIPPRAGKVGFDERDLTRALKASVKAGLTPHRVELLTDGRILLQYAAPPPLPNER